jgi:hypothetical protein
VAVLRTTVDLLIPGRPINEVRDLARTRSVGWYRKGLIVRVKGDRIRARINERSRYSQTPTLVGRLIPTTAGTRVVGTIRWTLQLANLAIWGVGFLLCLVFGLYLLRDGRVLDGLILVVFSLFFGGLAVFFGWILRVEREHETTRLTDEIRRTFARRR